MPAPQESASVSGSRILARSSALGDIAFGREPQGEAARLSFPLSALAAGDRRGDEKDERDDGSRAAVYE